MKRTNISPGRLFLCPVVPENVRKRHSLSVAANNFCNNMIDSDIFDDVYVYACPQLDCKDEMTFQSQKIHTLMSSRLRKSSFSRRFAFIAENVRIFREIKKHTSVWFYNLPYTIMLLFGLLRVFKPSVKLYLILLDYTPDQGGLRALFNRFEMRCFKAFNGVISLANINELQSYNCRCMPGVVPKKKIAYPVVENFKAEFLISGALGENISMLTTLLDVFANASQLRLHITGRAPNPDIVKSYAERYANILYHDMVEFNEFLDILHNVPFLLSTRNPKCLENQCNFPSKVIEGLLHNRIIISTIDYPQLGGIKYFKIRADKEQMLEDLLAIASMNNEDLLKYANQGELVSETFSTARWEILMKEIENYNA